MELQPSTRFHFPRIKPFHYVSFSFSFQSSFSPFSKVIFISGGDYEYQFHSVYDASLENSGLNLKSIYS